ncbi:dihydrolipoyl dehydrogenase [Nocardioides sp. LMS-CY]|uniref:dihydrolipoyl dehydrogenase n=1 Tax=Nocardioides sp. (strain LMS-CY) TaxID=2840457 RepID=UPI001C00070E|nr:dihydrolipoyl dehydrogenase [Nocardioides sp. LMS-CY]QWF24783.1 dihydrolipoyl dehydrogenase [Nocardioides sp. LMS-CY]
MLEKTFDVVVLGGGSGGYAAALRSAQLGRTVALIEKDKLGGTCLHRGCIPTKALLHAGEVADTTRAASRYGVGAAFTGIDMTGVLGYLQGVVEKNWKGLDGLIRSRGIEVVDGVGRLVGPTSVRVGDTVYTGTDAVLATGSRPRSLSGIGVDGDRILTSEHALALTDLPDSAVVLGGGVIGCEFASAWHSLGVEVTVVEALPRLVPLEDEASSRLLERAFRRRGIQTRLGLRVGGVDAAADGVRVTLTDGTALEADVVLVAIGREAVVDDLGYEQQGVLLDRGTVVADEFCRTAVPHLYAVGDLLPTLQLAHVGFAEGILAAEHAAGLDVTPIDYPGVPRVTYSSPEVASVGLTETQARERYGDGVGTVSYDLSGNGKSAILGTQGAVKLVAAPDGTVVGAHIVGDRVGELIAEAQLIVNWQAVAEDVASLVHPHPTQGEAIGEAHLLLAGRPLHVHE